MSLLTVNTTRAALNPVKVLALSLLSGFKSCKSPRVESSEQAGPAAFYFFYSKCTVNPYFEFRSDRAPELEK